MKPVRDFVHWYLRKKQLVTVPASQAPTFSAALHRLKKRNLRLGTIIDVGASDGRWTAAMLPFHPDARYLCIEALPVHEQTLKAFASAHPQVTCALCAAGPHEGHVSFDTSGDVFAGAVQEIPSSPNSITVTARTIDSLVSELRLPPPYLIKLDTHGYELPILDGAAQVLTQTDVLIVEVANFPGGAPAVPFYEFCRLMAAKGFRCIDMYDPLYRPTDQALWQMDMVFMRDSRPEFQDGGYG